MIACYVVVYAVLVGIVLAVAIVWIGLMRKPLDERRVRGVLATIIVMGWFVAMGYVLALTERLPTIPLPTGLQYTWASLLSFPVAVVGVFLFLRIASAVVGWLKLSRERTRADRLKTADTCFMLTAWVLIAALAPTPRRDLPARADHGLTVIELVITFGPFVAAYLYYKLGTWCVRRILGDPDDPTTARPSGPALNG